MEESTIYAEDGIAQVAVDRPLRRTMSINAPKAFGAKFLDCRAAVSDAAQLDWHFTETPYNFGSISSRTKSSGVCRLRMRANLSPRTSASAGNGREL
jgi:hypothetical protein